MVSFIDGLHPKDSEAVVEKSANAAIYASAKTFEELNLYVRTHDLCPCLCGWLCGCVCAVVVSLSPVRVLVGLRLRHRSATLLQGVYGMKFTRPSKIQAESLPIVLSNK